MPSISGEACSQGKLPFQRMPCSLPVLDFDHSSGDHPRGRYKKTSNMTSTYTWHACGEKAPHRRSARAKNTRFRDYRFPSDWINLLLSSSCVLGLRRSRSPTEKPKKMKKIAQIQDEYGTQHRCIGPLVKEPEHRFRLTFLCVRPELSLCVIRKFVSVSPSSYTSTAVLPIMSASFCSALAWSIRRNYKPYPFSR